MQSTQIHPNREGTVTLVATMCHQLQSSKKINKKYMSFFLHFTVQTLPVVAKTQFPFERITVHHVIRADRLLGSTW